MGHLIHGDAKWPDFLAIDVTTLKKMSNCVIGHIDRGV